MTDFATAFKERKAHLKKFEKKEVEQGLDVFFLASSVGEQYQEKVYNKERRSRGRRRPVLLEIFAGIMMLSRVAMSRGWEVIQPEDYENGGADLLTPQGRNHVDDVLDRFDPDLVSMAPPCSPWSQLQQILPKDPVRRRRKIMWLARLRQKHQPLWLYCKRVVQR